MCDVYVKASKAPEVHYLCKSLDFNSKMGLLTTATIFRQLNAYMKRDSVLKLFQFEIKSFKRCSKCMLLFISLLR